MNIEIEREKLERMLMLLAVATFHTPALQAERTELVEAGLKDLAAPVQVLQRYSPDGEGGMEMDSLGAYVKHQDVTNSPAAPVQEKWGLSAVMNPDYVAAQKQKAQQALDVMAENARELGLDYEPAPENFIDALKFDVAMRDAAPVQEPVGNWVWSWLMDWCKRNGIAPATQDSLFAMVKDARSKFESTPPAAQRQWVGLTDDEIIDLIHPLVMADMPDQATDYEIARAIEAELKEKNTP
jgi:hypothetical protein